MIKAIFYARFHHEKGNIVAHQVPPGSITAPPSTRTDASSSPASPSPADEYPLFDFGAIDKLLIPRREFCDRLVTVCTNHYRIIGHPVCIQSARYERNEFIFNLAVVLDEEAEFSAYTSIVRKLARMLRQLEEQSQFLSREEERYGWGVTSMGSISKASVIASLEGSGELEKLPILDELAEQAAAAAEMTGSGLLDAYEKEQGKKVYALCEMIMEDLNNYCECMIPIDSSNTINLKLFPTRPPPAPVYAWHVPLSTADLTTIAQSSDLTLTRIIPYIDGIASVSQISQRADTDLGLTRKAIQHLLYYGCVLLLDIFQFGAIYAPTAEIGAFIEDDAAQEEAIQYVCMGTYRKLRGSEASSSSKEEWGWISKEVGIDKARLVRLYTSLRQGLVLKHWCSEHNLLLSGIDVRRFITFGIIKGFLYRVHKYVVASSVIGGGGSGTIETSATNGAKLTAGNHVEFRNHHHNYEEAMDRRYSVLTSREPGGGYYSRRASMDGDAGDASQPQKDQALPLARYLDGLHCLDEICTEVEMGEKRVLEKMKAAFGDIQVIHR